MAQNYESIVLMDPTLADTSVQDYIGKFSQEIVSRGGEIVQTQVWGKRRLAYPIAHRDEAIYAILYFRIEKAGNLVDELERIVRINDELLREMTVKVPELRMVNQGFGHSSHSAANREESAAPSAPAGEESSVAVESVEDSSIAVESVEESTVAVETEEGAEESGDSES
jgi:small subunit ribosomal protein S6